MEGKINLQDPMLPQYLDSGQGIRHAPKTLARGYIGCKTRKLHIQTNRQCMGEIAMFFARHICQDWPFWVRVGLVRCLFSRLSHAYIDSNLMPSGNKLGGL